MLNFAVRAYDATPTAVGSAIPSPDYWGLILFFVLFFALMIGGMYLLKRLRNGAVRGGGLGGTRCLERIDSLSLSASTRVVLVRAGEKYFLLGVGDKQVSPLGELSRQDIAEMRDSGQTAGIGSMFKAAEPQKPREDERDVLAHDPVPWQTKWQKSAGRQSGRDKDDRLIELEDMMERRRTRSTQPGKDDQQG